MGNVTLVSTDPQEVVDRILKKSVDEEATLGEVAEESAETAAESQTAQPESKEEEQPRSKRSQKIKRLAEKLTEAEQKIAEYERRLESRREEAPKETQKADPLAYPVPKPKAEDFKEPQEFVEALADWKADEREYKNAVREEQEANQAAIDAHFERVDEAREKYEDFDETVEAADQVRFRNDSARNAFYVAIYENEDGPDVLYYLAKNPEAAESFAEMTPGQVAAKIGRIAASLPNGSPKPQAAPPPRLIKPVGAGAKRPEVPTNRDNLSHREWKQLRKAGKIG